MLPDSLKLNIARASELILTSELTVAFTGAGISVESGIPPFRGEDGLWSKHDPSFLEIDFFHSHPKRSWQKIVELFYDNLLDTEPNPAHYALAELENMGLVEAVITQNIDDLHRRAGSRNIHEFHGTAGRFICEGCGMKTDDIDMSILPPRCTACNSVMKPDFIFFGEPILEDAREMSFRLAEACDVMILVGTSGFVVPASYVPAIAKQSGAQIIEINLHPSTYTNTITDIFLEGRASEVLGGIMERIKGYKSSL